MFLSISGKTPFILEEPILDMQSPKVGKEQVYCTRTLVLNQEWIHL